MSMQLIDGTKETACRTSEANAIRAKTGSTEQITYDFENGKGFADAIAAIPSGNPCIVRFYDINGVLLSSEPISSIATLPESPVHSGLTFTGWSHTIAAIQASDIDVTCMATYEPTDCDALIKLIVSTSGSLAVPFYFNITGSITIDFGDGTTQTVSDTTTTSVTHTYSSLGYYNVKFTVNSGTLSFGGSGADASITGNNATYKTYPVACYFKAGVILNAYALNCSRLSELSLPSDITIIPSYLIYGAGSLTSLTIPYGCVTLDSNSLRDSGLVRCVLPSSLVRINSNSFYACSVLRDVYLPDSLKIISDGSFYNCSSIRNLIIPAGVTNNMTYAFNGCRFETIGVGENALQFKGDTIRAGVHNDTVLSACPIKNINLPSNIKHISGYLFAYCSQLESVTIDDHDINLLDGGSQWGGLFTGCSRLVYANCNSIISSENRMHYNNYMLKEVHYKGITSLGEGCFSSCGCLETAEFGNVGTTFISCPSGAFYGCINPSLVITCYTISSYVDTLLTNIRNGATYATIIFKAAADTVYNGVTYQAGDTIMTSAVS